MSERPWCETLWAKTLLNSQVAEAHRMTDSAHPPRHAYPAFGNSPAAQCRDNRSFSVIDHAPSSWPPAGSR